MDASRLVYVRDSCTGSRMYEQIHNSSGEHRMSCNSVLFLKHALCIATPCQVHTLYTIRNVYVRTSSVQFSSVHFTSLHFRFNKN